MARSTSTGSSTRASRWPTDSSHFQRFARFSCARMTSVPRSFAHRRMFLSAYTPYVHIQFKSSSCSESQSGGMRRVVADSQQDSEPSIAAASAL